MSIDATFRETWERDFYQFAAAAWPILEPSRPWRSTWYRRAIAEHLECLWRGQFRRLLIEVPPQSGKSTLVTKLFPAWVWLQDPSARLIFDSYSFESLGVPFSIQRRKLIESPWFQGLWGEKFKLAADDNLKWRYSNNFGGYHVAVTGATGIGADLLVVDDPHSADEARSDAERTATIKRFRDTLMARLTPGGRELCVIVCQRLHERDLAGDVLQDGTWTELKLDSGPLEEPQKVRMPFSRRILQRKQGSFLDPVTMGAEFLEMKKLELGPSGFSAQYRQSPAPAEGIIFNPKWWERYEKLPELEMIIVSVDANFKANRDEVSAEVWGFTGPHSYLIAKTTDKMGYIRTKETIRNYARTFAVNAVLIEEAANGSAIIEELQGEFPVIGLPPVGSKEARAQACAPQVAAGFVHVEAGANGDKFLTDAAKFPLGANDHDVDSMSQALNWRRQNTFGLMEYYKQEAKKEAQKRAESQQHNAIEKSAHIRLPEHRGWGVPECPDCGKVGAIVTHFGEYDLRRCRHCGSESRVETVQHAS